MIEHAFSGPPPEKGPLPVFIYFALSAEESLGLDPFNQPVSALKNSPVRCLSFTLPFHEGGGKGKTAMQHWFSELDRNRDFLTPFLHECAEKIQKFIDEGIIDPEKIAAGGLSRGGFTAAHLAAIEPQIRALLLFAPFTKFLEEHKTTPLHESFELENLTDALADRSFKIYIGNRDQRVSTPACFSFYQTLVEKAHAKGIRSPQMEMVLFPSIGYKGHGTPPEIFASGAEWIKRVLQLPGDAV